MIRTDVPILAVPPARRVAPAADSVPTAGDGWVGRAERPLVMSPFAPPLEAARAVVLPDALSSAAAAHEVSRGVFARMLGMAGLALLAIGTVGSGVAHAQTAYPTVPSVPLPFEVQQGQSDPNSGFDDFITRMREAKQQAQRQAPRPTAGERSTAAVGVSVTAHSFYKGNQRVGVSNIRIAESGDYGNRTSQSFTNYGGSASQSLRLGSGHAGRYYNVYVTWADGTSQTYNVRADAGGARLDAWKY